MKTVLTFLSAFISLTVSSQRSTLTVTYGNQLYDKPLLGQVNTLDSFQFGMPVQYVGFGANGHFVMNDKVNFGGHMIVAKYLTKYVDVNDSTIAKLSGSSFGFGYGFDCLSMAENIDFILSVGANIGRMKITQAVNPYTGEKIGLSVKNMFISPKASAMLILYVGNTSLSLNAEYAYDVSATGWKSKIFGRDESGIAVPAFQQSGLGFSVALGYAF
ncbi:MAG TPA: hypothetical protein VK151_18180 [Fluviicola sp.]|nr:hypothetical protein [Fluviicola sp.]